MAVIKAMATTTAKKKKKKKQKKKKRKKKKARVRFAPRGAGRNKVIDPGETAFLWGVYPPAPP